MLAIFLDGPKAGTTEKFPFDCPVLEFSKPRYGLMFSGPDEAANLIVCYKRISVDTCGNAIFKVQP